MGRQVRDYRLGSPEARTKLTKRHEPYWREITPGLHIGYRKGERGGIWWGRFREDVAYVKWRLGVADDTVKADGINFLSFTDADRLARLGPSGKGGGRLETVSDVMAYYMKQQRAESRSADTTQYAVDQHIIPALGSKKVSKLKVDTLNNWRNDMAKPKKKKGKKKASTDSPREAKRKRQASANRVLTILKAALNYAESTGKYRGPTEWKLVKPFRRVDATEHAYLTRDEAIRLQNACDPDFRLLVRGALETGCRYGELCAMKVSDFNPDAGTITVRESKSGKIRHVHLTESGQVFFDDLTINKSRRDRLFLHDGQPWGKSHQFRPIRKAYKQAGIDPPVPFKSLRTTYGSLLALEGVPLQVIAAALGHADTRITEKHYAHLMPNYVADMIRANLPTFGDKKSNIKRLKQK